MSETLPSPDLPSASVVAEQKLRAVLASMREAVGAQLATKTVDSFGRAARICVMGQKIAGELVTTVREAKKVQALDDQQLGLAGHYGAEGQYIAQGGGDINAYVAEQADYAILNPPNGNGGLGGPHFVGDQTQMTRDLMMMVQAWFEDQKKSKAERVARPPSRADLYDELNQAFSAVAQLGQIDPVSPHLAVLNAQINLLVDQIAKGESHETPDTVHVVPAELLRGHPAGAGEQWGDSADHRRPVLYGEDSGPGAPLGGEADGHHQAGMGAGDGA